VPLRSHGANDDIVASGCWFRANVSLNTPLAVLHRHGEHFLGPVAGAPVIAGGQHGGWQVRMKTWRELGVDLPDLASAMASPIGPVTPDEVIPFLVAFREIVEANLDHRTHVAMLLELGQHAAHSPYWQRFDQSHQDLPYSFFYFPLTALPGIGRKTAKSLYEAGIYTREDIGMAALGRLSAVRGIGRAKAEKLKLTCQVLPVAPNAQPTHHRT
jgi:hypothetical protein